MKSLFVSCVIGATLIGHAVAQKQVPVTAVAGESWIGHLHRALEETSMGKTGFLGPATLLPTPVAAQSSASVRRLAFGPTMQSVTLHGADLYRLNCQACHGELGLGAPPEIASIINASRATYAPFTMDRLNKLGMETSRTQANELANQAKGALLQRLHDGGVDMPSFPQLSEPEVRSLFAYLRKLAEIPGAEGQQVRIEEPSVRVGEHIVKSTCHICHSAAGVNPSPNELMQGAIPPLSSLTTRVSLPEFERKVRHGAPILMGTPLLSYRGRMPVFEYLTEREVADAYSYLELYPPTAWTDPVTPPDRAQQAAIVASAGEPPNGSLRGEASTPSHAGVPRTPIIPIIAGVVVSLLLVSGAIFTVHEMKRSKPRVMRFNAMAGCSLGRTTGGTFVKAKRVPHDPHKQAAWRSRLHRSEHDVFESSWFSRHLENEDGAA